MKLGMQQAARCAWGDDAGIKGLFHNFIPTALAVVIIQPSKPSFYIFSFWSLSLVPTFSS